ncbi:MAG: metallophosphoesterase family protein [Lachnospiraceae bacterium]|nr:metallophosphoesterase family protein [Lachnospiraceae bacterium]
MKLCIFADVHGNAEAFVKMMEREYGHVDRFVFAGDIFGYFYDQPEIIDRMISLPDLLAVKGNHEQYYLGGTSGDLIDRYGSSYELQLSEIQRKYVEELPDHEETVIDGKRVAVFHGGPGDFLEERIYPDTALSETIASSGWDCLILAHTHYGMLRKIGKTTVVNPGSLGQPRDGKGFGYCVWDTETDTFMFRTVDVKTADLLEQVRQWDAEKYVYRYLSRKYDTERS